METFESYIKTYLENRYNNRADELYNVSLILQYIAYKTRSANKGAKARSSFANLYAIYVIVEDYLQNGFDKNDSYKLYSGARFSTLFRRQRELPFGAKLQNHALNSRLNDEFFKLFPMATGMPPIMRNLETQRYWFNENYLKLEVSGITINIANDIINIIDHYVEVKQRSLKLLIHQCEKLQIWDNNEKPEEATDFIISLLAPNVDARLFEITRWLN